MADENQENNETEKNSILKGKKGGSFFPIILVLILSSLMYIYWNKAPFIKNAVHAVLDPSAGALLKWNLTIGMFVVVFAITVITTTIQKYTTDQKALKELKKEQKLLQEEMKKYKDHPEKIAELSKKQFEFIPKTFKLTSRGVLFTGIPFILFFRWFNDYFTALGNPDVFLGFGWFGTYFISAIIFGTILRKIMKVV
jgi:uncharacterized membrane protein (DUF106 family)